MTIPEIVKKYTIRVNPNKTNINGEDVEVLGNIVDNPELLG